MERSMTKLKDADREILLRIDSDKELLQMCHLNKYLFSLCDSDFYRKRMEDKFPNLLEFYPIKTNWKQAYLQNTYYIGKMEEDYKFNFSSISTGLPKVYYDILKRFDTNVPKDIQKGFKNAGVNGFFDLADFFISLGANNFTDGLMDSIFSHKSLNIVEYFLNKIDEEKLPEIIPLAFQASVGVDNKLAMDYFVSKIDLNEALINSAINKNYKVIYYLITQGANVIETIRIAAERQLPEIALLLEKYYTLYLKANALKFKK